MSEAYRIASSNASKSAESRKRQYDKKVKQAVLQPGERVLVRNLSERGGTGKLRSFWENEVHVVVGKRDDMPVYEVKKENGEGSSRVLHRNLLLPCSHLPTEGTQIERKASGKRNRRRQRQPVRRKTTTTPTETEGDDQECGEIGFSPQALKTLYETRDSAEPETTLDPQTTSPEEYEPVGQGVESDDEVNEGNVLRRTQRVSRPPNRLTYDYLGQPSLQPCVTAGVQGMSVTPQQWWRPPMFQWNTAPTTWMQPWWYFQPGVVY